MMGQVGTPVIAVESGYVEAMGWNQYGGWRLGIRSFDHKRYYYYAHLRKNYPYQSGLKEGLSLIHISSVIWMSRFLLDTKPVLSSPSIMFSAPVRESTSMKC